MGRVVEVGDADIRWGFHNAEPRVPVAHRSEAIDPFPCYAHDVRLVAKTLRACDRIVGGRVKFKPTVYVLHHDTPARTNGWAEVHGDYQASKKDKPVWAGVIVLPGKRIPLHPAMTRYVTAHEYGHHAEYELCRRVGREPGTHPELRDEYAALRGLQTGLPYGGRTWHLTAGEVFANDFRILLAGIEPEFWPHPCAHPLKAKGLAAWWREHF